jgi:hypothetical protein
MKVPVPPAKSATAQEKVFWFFSSEKNTFPPPPALPKNAGNFAIKLSHPQRAGFIRAVVALSGSNARPNAAGPT